MFNNVVPVPLNKRNNVKLIKMGFLGNFANFIRNKTGLTNAMTPEEMPDYIRKMDLQFVNPNDYFSIFTDSQLDNKWNNFRNKNVRITSMYVGKNVLNMEGNGVFGNPRNVFYLAPVCGPNVTSMRAAYYDCYNVTGSPVCGPNVINMSYAYYHCYNLTGSPVCGPNVNDMEYAYGYCNNLTGSPVCGPNVISMSTAYFNCHNLTGSPVCGPNVTDMYYAYHNCYNLTGSPACGPNVTNMAGAYRLCRNLTGSPVCGPNVTDMCLAYYHCYNLTGSPVCSPNVINMLQAYEHCHNLAGSPIIGPAVTNADYAYTNCSNLTGSIKISSTTTHLNQAFANTRNISSIYITGSRTNANLSNAFNRAAVLAELNEGETLPRMNIIFSTGGANLLNNVKVASVTGCTMTAVAGVTGEDAQIEFPWTYGNGEVYFRNNVTVKRGCYNVLHNIYMYTVN